MTQLTVSLNESDFKNVHSMLRGVEKSIGTVIQQSVNRTLTGVRTDSTNEVSKVITPTKKAIRKSMTFQRMTAKDGNAIFKCRGKPLNLIHFKARETMKGVTVQVLKSGGRKLIPHAFKTKIINELVAVRQYKGPRKKRIKRGGSFKWYGILPNKYRFPNKHLKFLTSLAIPDVLGHKPTIDEVLRLCDVRLSKNLNARLNYELSKLK